MPESFRQIGQIDHRMTWAGQTGCTDPLGPRHGPKWLPPRGNMPRGHSLHLVFGIWQASATLLKLCTTQPTYTENPSRYRFTTCSCQVYNRFVGPSFNTNLLQPQFPHNRFVFLRTCQAHIIGSLYFRILSWTSYWTTFSVQLVTVEAYQRLIDGSWQDPVTV